MKFVDIKKKYSQCVIHTILAGYTQCVYTNVRRKTAPDFLEENMIDLDKQFLNPAPKNARRPWRAEAKIKEFIK
jgi:hypothetical protein